MINFFLTFLLGWAMATSSVTFNDTVRSIEVDGPKIRIAFRIHAAFYRIDKNRPGFEALKKKLEASHQKKQPIEVTVDPTELTILDVK